MTWFYMRGDFYWVPDVPGAWQAPLPVTPPSPPDSWHTAPEQVREAAQRALLEQVQAMMPPLPDGWLAVPSYPQVTFRQDPSWPGYVQATVHVTVQPPVPLPDGMPPYYRDPEPGLARHFLPPRWLLNTAALILVATVAAVLILLTVRLS